MTDAVTHHADSVTHHVPFPMRRIRPLIAASRSARPTSAIERGAGRDGRKYPPEPDALALAALVVESLDELTPDAIESAAQRARKQRTSG
jgi:hypothetical protein